MDVKMFERRSRAVVLTMAVATATLVLGVGVATPAMAYHYPWDQGHDTVDWNDPQEPGPPDDPLTDCGGENGQATGSPVYVQTGHFVWGENLATLPGEPVLRLGRTYNSNDPRAGIFGNGWSSGCEAMLIRSVKATGEGGKVEYILRVGTGKRYVYEQQSDGTIATPPGRNDRVVLPGDGSGAPIDLVARDGTIRRFDAAGRLIRRERPDGQAIHYSYDDAGRLTRIAASGGRHFDLVYSSQGFVATVTDHAGRSWRHEYDGTGNLVRITDPEGGVRRFEYRAHSPSGDNQTYHQLTRIVDAAGVAVTEVTYDGVQVSSYTAGENRFDYRYDPGDRTTTRMDRRGDQWTYVYNDHGVIVRRTNPAGETRQYTYDDDGNLLSETDPAGAQWSYSYDEHKRRLSATDPLGNTREWEYDRPWPGPTATISASGRRTGITYDDSAQPVRITDPTGAETQLSYDGEGHLSAIRDALGNTTTITTDTAGRPVTVTDALGRSRRISYDAAGNVTAVTHPDGGTYRYAWDGNRRLLSVTEPSGAVTRFAYDAAGRRTAVTDPKGQTTRFEYDGHGRMVRRTAPDGSVREYRYRQDNRLREIVRADGTLKTYGYDAAKRLSSITAEGATTTFDYNARGQLVEANNPTGTVTRSFDAAGRLVSETVNGETVSYRYNPEGERTNYTALGAEIDYERSPRGRLTAITAPEGRYDLGRDALGRRTALAMPHGERVDYAYNAASELTDMTFSGPYIEQYDYAHDARGRVTRWTTNAFEWTYGYDADGQLTSADSALGTYSYDYDAAGNLTGDGQIHDAANRLQRDADYTYAYDGRGNLTGKRDRGTGERWVYEWDGRNRLVRRAHYPDADAGSPDRTTTYSYGPLGRRWSRTRGGTEQRFVYAGLDRIATLDASGNTTQRVTFGPRIDEPLAITRGGQTRYLHGDRLGSITAASTASETVAAYRYSPYGRLINDPADIANDFRYTGREYEGDSLYYYRARYYDTGMRRFTAEDPISLRSGDTNLYGYVANDPANSVDPMGLYHSLPNAYYHGMARAMERYIRYWMEVAGTVATAAVGGPTAGAVRTGVSQMCRVSFSKLPAKRQEWYLRNASKVNDAMMGAVSEAGAPPATAAGAGGVAGRLIYDIQAGSDD